MGVFRILSKAASICKSTVPGGMTLLRSTGLATAEIHSSHEWHTWLLIPVKGNKSETAGRFPTRVRRPSPHQPGGASGAGRSPFMQFMVRS